MAVTVKVRPSQSQRDVHGLGIDGVAVRRTGHGDGKRHGVEFYRPSSSVQAVDTVIMRSPSVASSSIVYTQACAGSPPRRDPCRGLSRSSGRRRPAGCLPRVISLGAQRAYRQRRSGPGRLRGAPLRRTSLRHGRNGWPCRLVIVAACGASASNSVAFAVIEIICWRPCPEQSMLNTPATGPSRASPVRAMTTVPKSVRSPAVTSDDGDPEGRVRGQAGVQWNAATSHHRLRCVVLMPAVRRQQQIVPLGHRFVLILRPGVNRQRLKAVVSGSSNRSLVASMPAGNGNCRDEVTGNVPSSTVFTLCSRCDPARRLLSVSVSRDTVWVTMRPVAISGPVPMIILWHGAKAGGGPPAWNGSLQGHPPYPGNQSCVSSAHSPSSHRPVTVCTCIITCTE